MNDPRHSEQSTGIRLSRCRYEILAAKGTSHVCGTNDGYSPAVLSARYLRRTGLESQNIPARPGPRLLGASRRERKSSRRR